MYLTAVEHRKNRSNPQAKIMGWHQILNPLAVLHPDRITIDSPTITTENRKDPIDLRRFGCRV